METSLGRRRISPVPGFPDAGLYKVTFKNLEIWQRYVADGK
jgi:hypothetical protein